MMHVYIKFKDIATLSFKFIWPEISAVKSLGAEQVYRLPQCTGVRAALHTHSITHTVVNSF